MSELEQLSGYMQSFELLGGKYQQGELIAPGVIQTFRSYEVSTCRPVFIHRIPMDHAAAPELAELLSAGLIRSSAVRSMIVDLYETGPYRLIVTEAARQCVPLLDWLEREAGELVETVEDKPEAQLPKEESAKEQVPNQKMATENPSNSKTENSRDTEFGKLFLASSAKLERAEGAAALPRPASIPPPVEPPASELPVSTDVSQWSTPLLPPPTRRSNLVLFLVVLGVVAVAVAMGVVFFLKK
jgi:hypothetical protein